MIYGIFVFFHIVACLVLIGVILLQSGRGGGLSEMAGGQGAQQSQKLFGTQTNALLMKFTSYCAIVFLITSISLVLMTSRRSKSLMEGARIQPIFDTQTPAAADGKPVDKKTLEEAVKALAEAAKKSQTEAGKAVEQTQAEGAKLAETAAPQDGSKALEESVKAVSEAPKQ
jgi:preprotein translocase subunit SecG